MHRPVGYASSTPSMRWKILFIIADDAVIAITPLTDGNGQNVDELTELLESRAAQSSEDTYYEIDVFEEHGPDKRPE